MQLVAMSGVEHFMMPGHFDKLSDRKLMHPVTELVEVSYVYRQCWL
jgi:hypothetical protein